MGSFNVGCGISNLAIEMGDDIGFVILTPSEGNMRRNPENGFATLVHNDDLYKPFLPPVFGMYGDYGYMNSIEKSTTTELLENMFSRPIEDIIECITCGGGPYDSGRIYEKYFTGSKKFREFGVTHEVALTELGFMKVDSGKSEEIYRLGDVDIVARPSEQHELLTSWTLYKADTEEVLASAFISQFVDQVLEHFAKVTGIFPGYDEKDYAAIQALSKFYGMYFLKDAFTGMKTHSAKNDYFFSDRQEAYEKMWKEFCAGQIVIAQNPEESWETTKLPYTRLGQFIDRYTGFPVEGMMNLSIYGSSLEYFEIGHLMAAMSSVNRMFLPSFCGSQDGDTDASLALNAITNKILKARKSEEDRYNS